MYVCPSGCECVCGGGGSAADFGRLIFAADFRHFCGFCTTHFKVSEARTDMWVFLGLCASVCWVGGCVCLSAAYFPRLISAADFRGWLSRPILSFRAADCDSFCGGGFLRFIVFPIQLSGGRVSASICIYAVYVNARFSECFPIFYCLEGHIFCSICPCRAPGVSPSCVRGRIKFC